MGLEYKMRPEMETTRKDLYHGLWDCPESFPMEAKKHKVCVLECPKSRYLVIFGPPASFLAKVPQAFWTSSGAVCQVLYEASFIMIV